MVMADADRNPTYLRELAGHVAEFRAAFVSLLELHTPTYLGPGRGIAPPVSPRDGIDQADLEARRARVSTAAGRARRAPGLTGAKFGVEGHRGAVDPIAAWNTVTQPKPVLEPANIIDACDQMIGSLDDLAARAEAEAPPTVDVAQMHPAVWGQVARLTATTGRRCRPRPMASCSWSSRARGATTLPTRRCGSRHSLAIRPSPAARACGGPVTLPI
jgi:hypothetical protein